MRIRYWCHQCDTLYGSGRDCLQCAHRRCNQCVRHPPKRPLPRVRLEAARARNASSVENLPSGSRIVLRGDPSQPDSPPEPTYTMPSRLASSDNSYSQNRTPLMTRQEEPFPGARLNQQPPSNTRINKDHRVRIHYTCHECQRIFSHNEYVCAGCAHERCQECPRDPPRVRRRHETPRSEIKNKRLERKASFSGSESDDAGPGHSHTIPEHPPGTTNSVIAVDTTMS